METIHPPVPSDELLTVAQAARVAGCSKMTVHWAIADGRVRIVRVGSRRYVPIREAVAFGDRVQYRGRRATKKREG